MALAIINLMVVARHQPAARRPRARALSEHRPGHDHHRAVPRRGHRRDAGEVPDDLGGGRRRDRLRAAGHAGQHVLGPGDPGGEAVPGRPLGTRRRPTRDRSARSRGGRRRSARKRGTSSSCRMPSSRRKPSPTTPEPTAPTRLEVEVGVSYGVPPEPGEGGARSRRSATRRWRWRRRRRTSWSVDFGASAVVYRVRFWMNDFARDCRGARRGEVGDLLLAAAPRVRDPVPDAD